MRILLLEDEPLAARRTRGYLARYGEGVTEAGWCQSAAEADAWLAERGDPDLLVSDIELLDGNVFALFDRRPVACPVVFATAYDQFLLRAFEANGVGYLLKPYTYEQFAAAIDKVRGLLGARTAARANASDPAAPPAAPLSPEALAQLRVALVADARPRYRQRLTVRRPSGISILPLAEVALLLSEDKVTFAVDAAGKRHALSQSLTALEAELDPAAWLRVNRGELVHLAYVARLELYGRDRLAVHLRGPLRERPVASRDRTPALRRWIDA